MSRASYAGSGIHNAAAVAHSVVSSRRARPRSRSRDQMNGAHHIHSHHRPSSRYDYYYYYYYYYQLNFRFCYAVKLRLDAVLFRSSSISIAAIAFPMHSLCGCTSKFIIFLFFLLLSFFGIPLNMQNRYRYSTAGSTHTLNNYCDTSDNWTDHDMEIYMTRNATTRNGLVPL